MALWSTVCPVEFVVRKMVFSKYLSSLLLLALVFLSPSARASPYPKAASRTSTLKLAVRINSNGIRNIVAADRARVKLLQDGGSSSANASNEGLAYTADIGVGTPPTYCKLLPLRLFLDIPSVLYRHTSGRHWKLKYLGWGQQVLRDDKHQSRYRQFFRK